MAWVVVNERGSSGSAKVAGEWHGIAPNGRAVFEERPSVLTLGLRGYEETGAAAKPKSEPGKRLAAGDAAASESISGGMNNG